MKRAIWDGMITMVLLLPFFGCAQMEKGLNQIVGEIVCDVRKPGSNPVKDLNLTLRDHNCTLEKEMKFFLLESSLTPTRTKKDTYICHRISYAICPSKPNDSYSVRIERRILYQGYQVAQFSSSVAFYPGTWNVDAKIPVPGDAALGLYSVKATIYLEGKSYERVSDFQVVVEK